MQEITWERLVDLNQDLIRRPMVIRIREKYQLEFLLGGGTFSDVYQARDLQTGHKVALKLVHKDVCPLILEEEIRVLESLAGGRGIPHIYWYGAEHEYNILALQLLGPTLGNLLSYCGGKLSLKTVLLLVDQLIPSFRYIHSKGWIHRDVKPANILMGTGKLGNNAYVTDFNIATRFGHDEGPWNPEGQFVGTRLYASISAHLDHEQFPRDDMESLGYVLIYLLRGHLPWQRLKSIHILARKQSAIEGELYKDAPEEFEKYFRHIQSLRADEKPNYAYLQRLFRNLFHRNGYEYDNVFDWTALRYMEHLGEEKDEAEGIVNF